MKQGLTIRQKVFYGAGDIMGTMAFTVTQLFLSYFFIKVIGLSPFLAGLTILIGNVWDAVTDPWAGYISDKTRTRFGRRRPFFLTMALPIGITFVLLFMVPSGLPQFTTFILCTLAYMAFMTTTTFYLVPYLAYGMEIERSYDGRTSVTAWRMLFSIAFGLIGAVVPKIIWESSAVPSQGFLTMALILAVPVAISPLFAFFAGREPVLAEQPQVMFFRDLVKALKNNHFMKGVAIFIATWVGINAVQTLLIFYFKDVVNISDDFEIVIGGLFGVAILALPLWVYLSKKLDKRKAYILGASAFGVLILTLLLPSDVVLSILWFIVPLLGVAISSLHVMPSAILPEAIEAASGEKSGEGEHYGIMTFIYKIANALMQFGILSILGIFGYIQTEEEKYVVQPAAATEAIRLLIGLVPVVLLIGGIVCAARLKISRHGIIEQNAEPEPKDEGAAL